jgi:hypothetical protein
MRQPGKEKRYLSSIEYFASFFFTRAFPSHKSFGAWSLLQLGSIRRFGPTAIVRMRLQIPYLGRNNEQDREDFVMRAAIAFGLGIATATVAPFLFFSLGFSFVEARPVFLGPWIENFVPPPCGSALYWLAGRYVPVPQQGMRAFCCGLGLAYVFARPFVRYVLAIHGH